MALQTSGQISLNDIHVEVGGTSGSQVGINDTDVRALISSTVGSQVDFADFYGASSEVVLTSAGNVNGQAQRQEITVSSFISSGGTLRIPSSIWVWSDSTSTAALIIDISCTIINEGKIIGKGGAGGDDTRYGTTTTVGSTGGPAIKINSGVTGVTITNSSGAYIAGGGGGGGASPIYSLSSRAGGGGGAGGGRGGHGVRSNNGAGSFIPTQSAGGSGGSLNGSGTSGSFGFSGGNNNGGGFGGTAGGGGGNSEAHPSIYYTGSGGGGGGGRTLPGTATTASTGSYTTGTGSGAGNAGGNGHAGGGGGWGASGGTGNGGAGGSGGKAIEDSGQTYTLSNSGTVYGTT